MKRNKEKKAGLDAACSWDDADTQDALYPKRLFSVPDISYPDPKTAYQGFMDERSVMERIEYRENKAMEYIRNDVRRGQILGALVSLGSLATAGFCAWIGALWIIVLGTILPGLSTLFYWLLRRFGD